MRHSAPLTMLALCVVIAGCSTTGSSSLDSASLPVHVEPEAFGQRMASRTPTCASRYFTADAAKILQERANANLGPAAARNPELTLHGTSLAAFVSSNQHGDFSRKALWYETEIRLVLTATSADGPVRAEARAMSHQEAGAACYGAGVAYEEALRQALDQALGQIAQQLEGKG